MLDWFRALWGKNQPPLSGAPAVRRRKNYSAQTGFVYEYYYLGKRKLTRGAKAGLEFVFQVSADRKTEFPVSVVIYESAVRSWEKNHGRDLTETERYALAKMSLFKAFNERPAPSDLKKEVRASTKDIEEILQTLGIE